MIFKLTAAHNSSFSWSFSFVHSSGMPICVYDYLLYIYMSSVVAERKRKTARITDERETMECSSVASLVGIHTNKMQISMIAITFSHRSIFLEPIWLKYIINDCIPFVQSNEAISRSRYRCLYMENPSCMHHIYRLNETSARDDIIESCY